MKKHIIHIILVLCLFLSFYSGVSAANKKEYKDSEGKVTVIVDKDNANMLEEGGDFYSMEVEINDQALSCSTPAYFFTSASDPLLTEDYKDNWWQTLYYCNYDNNLDQFFHPGNVENDQCLIATDSMASLVQGDENLTFWELFQDTADCTTIVVQDVESHLLVSTCEYYLSEVNKIDRIHNNYLKSGKSSKFVDEYKNEARKLKEACNQSFYNASYNDGCAKRCLAYKSDKKIWDARFDLTPTRRTCGFSENILGWIGNIVKWIKYIVPVLVILIGIVDFIRAVAGSKDDDMKKAQSRFIRRLIAAALVYIVPSIIVFVLEKMGFIVEGCGIINL